MTNNEAREILLNEQKSTDQGATWDALQKAIELLYRVDDGYIITCVSRDDIKGGVLDADDAPKYDVSKIDDSDMERIASKMADAYLNMAFWIDLPIITEAVLEK